MDYPRFQEIIARKHVEESVQVVSACKIIDWALNPEYYGVASNTDQIEQTSKDTVDSVDTETYRRIAQKTA